MITIYTNKKEVFSERLRLPLIEQYETDAVSTTGQAATRYQFIADSLKAGKDTIDTNTLTAE